MLAKRIIPCLDVKQGVVVKGKKFKNHKVVGDILKLSRKYVMDGADELVFYDITASSDNKLVDKSWILKVAQIINIPFCVAGGIKSIQDVKEILSFGADKISINSPAIYDPNLIDRISRKFGKQCIVIGIDSWFDKHSNRYIVYQYTGREEKIKKTNLDTISWVKEVQERGAGEIVINMMNQDGMCNGYDIEQLNKIKDCCYIPLIASGGAGSMYDFYEVFKNSNVEGALAASVFHNNIFSIKKLKKFLINMGINIRIC